MKLRKLVKKIIEKGDEVYAYEHPQNPYRMSSKDRAQLRRFLIES